MAQSSDVWKWNGECEDVLHCLIRNITERPLLASFSPSKLTTLITDASEVGIGAVLEQDGYPIICISRLFNVAERGYSQTQKEALAGFWAVRRLHKYLFGLQFTIVTDHHALQLLFNPNKSIAKSTATMLQRWSIALAAYNYNILHRPGKAIPHADFLSRYTKFASVEQCNFTTQAAPVSGEELRKYTKHYYSSVMSALKKGWQPDVKKKYPQFLLHRE
ncbi:Ty3/Gypsy family RNase HI domain-containing protein [Streptococcus dysgalactiae subsp. equisimilis]|nr:Ty3/Gypsy family RNase HI domain-containing protein [Streptococcus dysgalactiae subsp. equisimilis]